MSRTLALRIKDAALDLGFAACGIAAAEPLPEARSRFRERIEQGHLDGLAWMNRARAERATTPEQLLRDARSIITLAAPYQHSRQAPPDDELRGRVAAYAWGRDYHHILEKRLAALCRLIDDEVDGSRSRVLVDYGPLAERAYSARAGIGWFGKSTNLLLPGIGSWVLLAEIVTTAVLETDVPLVKTCGACQRCVDACPTGALVDGYILSTTRCISYQTIENRGPIPRELRPLIGDWLFGCDLCQTACPVGRRDEAAHLAGLAAEHGDDPAPALLPLLRVDEMEFRRRFAGRAIMRAKRDGLVRNACVVLGNLGDERAVAGLSEALVDSSALVRGHAAWALGRIGSDRCQEALRAGLEREEDPWVQDEIESALLMLQNRSPRYACAPTSLSPRPSPRAFPARRQ